MTLALWCLLAGGLLPYVWTGTAKLLGGYSIKDNRQPRVFLAQLSGAAARANAAQLNSFEAFPLFAVAVLAAQYAHAAQARIDALAIAWVLLRVIHGLLYVADLARLRSLAWFGGVACVVALFVSAA